LARIVELVQRAIGPPWQLPADPDAQAAKPGGIQFHLSVRRLSKIIGNGQTKTVAAGALVGTLATKDDLLAFRRAEARTVILDDKLARTTGYMNFRRGKADGVLQHRAGELE
jgi:hypothetical protein